MSQKVLLLIVCLVITIDQATKSLARELSLIQLNYGVAFGLLQNSALADSQQFWAVFLLSMLCLGLLAAYLYVDMGSAIGFGLFFGGGLSNQFDRFFWGGVQDWIPLPVIGLRNNVADMAIAVGVAMVLYHIFVKIKIHTDAK